MATAASAAQIVQSRGSVTDHPQQVIRTDSSRRPG